ncbi:MAG: BtrH N-terminal domain-containing protein [Crocinitomicaceae bacterium]
MQEFKHYQAAHCENGVTVGLLKQVGLEQITEPLAFGIGSGLFYIEIPFLKLQSGPAISFRTFPGNIFKRTCKAFDVQLYSKKYRDEIKGMNELDALLAQGKSVGCQVGVFHLSYYPKEYRFHFNAHNLIAFGKEGNDYLVSDPVMEDTTRLSQQAMRKVRFAKGVLAPKGHIYYPTSIGIVTQDKLIKAIKTGIKRNCRDMLRIPASFIGTSGINYTAKNIRKWKDKLGDRKAALYLGSGLGKYARRNWYRRWWFSHLYAAFWKKQLLLHATMNCCLLQKKITKAGDMCGVIALFKWRVFTKED